MPEQPTGETPQQHVERELQAAREQVRRVAEQLRAGLSEDDRLAADNRARAAAPDRQQATGQPRATGQPQGPSLHPGQPAAGQPTGWATHQTPPAPAQQDQADAKGQY